MIDRRTLVTSVLAAMAMAPVSGRAQKKIGKVVVGVVTTAPPFSYADDDKITGISNDILQRIAELEKFEIEYVPLKFDALIPSIQAGQIDIAVSGIFVTEERKKIVDFSNPYHFQGAILVAPIDSAINNIASLKGKTLAAQQGSAALNIVCDPNSPACIQMRTDSPHSLVGIGAVTR
jgi:ABC-type amino acid transport substrate-binding protein